MKKIFKLKTRNKIKKAMYIFTIILVTKIIFPLDIHSFTELTGQVGAIIVEGAILGKFMPQRDLKKYALIAGIGGLIHIILYTMKVVFIPKNPKNG